VCTQPRHATGGALSNPDTRVPGVDIGDRAQLGGQLLAECGGHGRVQAGQHVMPGLRGSGDGRTATAGVVDGVVDGTVQHREATGGMHGGWLHVRSADNP